MKNSALEAILAAGVVGHGSGVVIGFVGAEAGIAVAEDPGDGGLDGRGGGGGIGGGDDDVVGAGLGGEGAAAAEENSGRALDVVVEAFAANHLLVLVDDGGDFGGVGTGGVEFELDGTVVDEIVGAAGIGAGGDGGGGGCGKGNECCGDRGGEEKGCAALA